MREEGRRDRGEDGLREGGKAEQGREEERVGREEKKTE